MTLTRALGEHLPRTLGDVAEHQNRLDWLTSSLISSLALIKCYQQSSADLKSEVLYLKEKILAMQEAQPHDGQDRFSPGRKPRAHTRLRWWYVAIVSLRLMLMLTLP